MKHYNIQNYIRYKKDLEQSIKIIDRCRHFDEFNRTELITIFMPLVENIARKYKRRYT
jgi:DNA-directed RNA polymerase specialized sigma subunit